MLITNGAYGIGATTITVTNLSGGTWKPAFAHPAGSAVENAGGVYMGVAETAYFAQLMVSRYNGTGTNYLTGSSQTPMFASAFQVNEDYDLGGTNLQRDSASKWFVTLWQTVDRILRAHAKAGTKLIGPAVRFTTDDGSGGTFGLAHITNWVTNLFAYTPPGSYAGAISNGSGGTILDALDFHWYRIGSTNFPTQAITIPPPRCTFRVVAAPSSGLRWHRRQLRSNGWPLSTAIPTWTCGVQKSGGMSSIAVVGIRPPFPRSRRHYFFGPSNAGNLTGHLGAYEQHRQNGGSHCFIWTMNSNAKGLLAQSRDLDGDKGHRAERLPDERGTPIRPSPSSWPTRRVQPTCRLF